MARWATISRFYSFDQVTITVAIERATPTSADKCDLHENEELRESKRDKAVQEEPASARNGVAHPESFGRQQLFSGSRFAKLFPPGRRPQQGGGWPSLSGHLTLAAAPSLSRFLGAGPAFPNNHQSRLAPRLNL